MKPASRKPCGKPATKCENEPADCVLRNPISGTSLCCAHPASGHAATKPPRSVMNSRRLIASPKGRQNIVMVQTRRVKGCPTVSFGQKGDIIGLLINVRVGPESRH